MTTENLVDAGHSMVDSFTRSLQELNSPESYKAFVIKFFDRVEKKELFLTIIASAQMSGSDLLQSEEFKIYFEYMAFKEFSRKLAGFSDEKIRLGFGV